MLRITEEKIHLSINVDHHYFMALDKITPIEALKVIQACLLGKKEILDMIISYHHEDERETWLYLSEVINAGIKNSEQQ